MAQMSDLEPISIPYKNAFSGRDVCQDSFNHQKGDMYWELTCQGAPITVIGLVEKMLVEGWPAAKEWVVKEKSMPTGMRVCELKQWGGVPLDLSRPDEHENDTDDEFPSDPPTFRIMSLAELSVWSTNGRPVPEDSHNSGAQEMHKHRHIKHPDDPLGLVVDKLARAIADERREGGSQSGKRLEPCFANVYSLGHMSMMKQLDKGLEFMGCGAFHAGCEAFGVEWSYLLRLAILC